VEAFGWNIGVITKPKFYDTGHLLHSAHTGGRLLGAGAYEIKIGARSRSLAISRLGTGRSTNTSLGREPAVILVRGGVNPAESHELISASL
jgi:hypothetical protein